MTQLITHIKRNEHHKIAQHKKRKKVTQGMRGEQGGARELIKKQNSKNNKNHHKNKQQRRQNNTNTRQKTQTQTTQHKNKKHKKSKKHT